MCKDRISFYEEKGLWLKKNLYEHLEEWAYKFNEKIALVQDNIELTYVELLKKANEFANGLVNLGVKKGDNVLVQLPNNISFVITSFALFKIGAVPIMSLPAHRESELLGIIEVSRPVLYIFQDNYMGFDYLKMAENLYLKSESIKKCIINVSTPNTVNILGESKKLNLYQWDSILCKALKDTERPSHRDIAILLLSGGTTSTPKLIPRTHADYYYNALKCAERSCLDENSIYLVTLPASHNFPLACPGIIGTFLSGGKVVISQSTSYDEAFELIEREKVTITSLVPAMLQLWLDALSWEDNVDLSSLKVIQIGGSMLDYKLAKKVENEINCKLQQVFGTAEGLICMTDKNDEGYILYETQGTPISKFDEVKIIDENGNELSEGEYGELVVRGPYTINNYYRGEKTHHIYFTPDGFYRTGDKARFVIGRNIQIAGRIKEQINRAGEKIMPSEIEGYLNKHPKIKESSLVGIPDEELGQRSVICLVLAEGNIALNEVHNYLCELKVARYKWPDEVIVMNYFPLTKVGKINKNKIKEIAISTFKS